MYYHFAFSYHSWGSQGKNTEVICHSLLQWTTFCQTSPPWPDRLGWPHTAWLSFIELDKTVVLGSDWLVFCDYGFSVSALWCPLATPTVLLGFLLPWTWGISSRLLQQSAVATPYLGQEDFCMAAPADLEHGVAPLGPHKAWGSINDTCPLVTCPLSEDMGKEFKQGHLSRRQFQEANYTHNCIRSKSTGKDTPTH